MLRFFVERFGVDYDQWRALSRLFVRKDFRESSMSSALHHGRSGKKLFVALLFFYFLMGLIFVPIVLSNENLFVSAVWLISYTMLMIGGLILVEYHSVIVSPDDYQVLGYQPLQDKAFFLSKLVNLLFYVLVYSSALALPAIIAFTFATGFDPLLGMTSAAAVFLANITTALSITVLYALILRTISLRKLHNILAIFQIGLSLTIYSSMFLLPRFLEQNSLMIVKSADANWLLFLPAAWFSSYLNIATGDALVRDWSMALLSIVVLSGVARMAFTKLSLGYSENLSRLIERSSSREKTTRKSRRRILFFNLGFEERVVAKLIRNQFIHDNKFKLAVLGILPLTFFYLLMGLEHGPFPDPFEFPEVELTRTGFLYLLIFLFPMMLRSYVTQSDAYKASWIFYVAPTDYQRMLLSEKNFLMIYFVLPFLLVLGLIFYYFFQSLSHVLLHCFALGLLAHLFLQCGFLFSTDLPFSRPNVKGKRSRNFAVLLLLVPLLLYFLLPFIFKYVYPNAISYLAFVATVLCVSLTLEVLIKVRVSIYMRRFEFDG